MEIRTLNVNQNVSWLWNENFAKKAEPCYLLWSGVGSDNGQLKLQEPGLSSALSPGSQILCNNLKNFSPTKTPELVWVRDIPDRIHQPWPATVAVQFLFHTPFLHNYQMQNDCKIADFDSRSQSDIWCHVSCSAPMWQSDNDLVSLDLSKLEMLRAHHAGSHVHVTVRVMSDNCQCSLYFLTEISNSMEFIHAEKACLKHVTCLWKNDRYLRCLMSQCMEWLERQFETLTKLNWSINTSLHHYCPARCCKSIIPSFLLGTIFLSSKYLLREIQRILTGTMCLVSDQNFIRWQNSGLFVSQRSSLRTNIGVGSSLL